ncbi:hypothetical protein LP414_27920 [Polaromonas sp. P1(28)-13]|nr:hypothetical protein LP414_27920 [Polaromonas sp. P1(28)-13]
MRENDARTAAALFAGITDTYNTGYLTGDIRRAYLASTTVESIGPTTELVTNGTFTTDTTGWTTGANAAISASGGLLTITRDAAGTGIAYADTQISAVVGRTYRVKADFIKGSAVSANFFIGTGANSGVFLTSASLFASGPFSFMFVATTTTPHITPNISTGANLTGSFDNISVKEVVADRSYKAAGASIYGTLVKTAVASAAQLVAYSGFSAANYLQEPYSADLDFGAGEWSASVAINTTNPGVANFLPTSQLDSGFSAEGTTPPAVVNAQTFLGKSATKVTFTTGSTPGYAGSRAAYTGVAATGAAGTPGNIRRENFFVACSDGHGANRCLLDWRVCYLSLPDN